MSSPAGARDEIAAALTARVPVDVSVVPFARVVDSPQRPTIMLSITGARAPDVACPVPTVELDAWAITKLTEPGAADDALDTLLGDLLDALEGAGIAWVKAERGVWNTTHPAYRVSLEYRL